MSKDVAAMGLDVSDLNLSINIGMRNIFCCQIEVKFCLRPSKDCLEVDAAGG